MLLLFLFLFFEFCIKSRRLICRLFSPKTKFEAKNRGFFFAFSSFDRMDKGGHLIDSKMEELGNQNAKNSFPCHQIFANNRQKQQMPSLIFCSTFCLLFDLGTLLFCLLVLFQMRRIVPSLPIPLLAISFGAPYFLIYGSLTVAILYDLRIRQNSDSNFDGM